MQKVVCAVTRAYVLIVEIVEIGGGRESEDTVLLILKELYALQGFAPQLATSRSASQPKMQLYNPAALLGNTSVAVPPPPTSLQSPPNSTTTTSGVPPLPLDGLSAPPPLQGFVRMSPLTRK
ncbi:hypothetical protein HPB51_021042 [Rhipicephalus microplus]|uniref:Uncharacterized protein n=1 Tax=Rhipicephalus microplus TaxID=6941 RepID=A0A9J6DCC6_RHIMP|nr:hypothetical protein HPB51_021042 [Rhipicephalus microplus]